LGERDDILTAMVFFGESDSKTAISLEIIFYVTFFVEMDRSMEFVMKMIGRFGICSMIS